MCMAAIVLRLPILCRSECEERLEQFMPMNLDYPGLNLLHSDPPIFSIDDFLTREECEGIIQGAAGQSSASNLGTPYDSHVHILSCRHISVRKRRVLREFDRLLCRSFGGVICGFRQCERSSCREGCRQSAPHKPEHDDGRLHDHKEPQDGAHCEEPSHQVTESVCIRCSFFLEEERTLNGVRCYCIL